MNDRLLVTRAEAARALSMSLSHFQRHVQPELTTVSSGQSKLFRQTDLERWIDLKTGLPATVTRGGMTLSEVHERLVGDCRSGVVLTKHGRPYRPTAITNLDSSLRRLPDDVRRSRLDAIRRGRLQEAVDQFRRERLSASRICAVINATRSLYRWALDREMAAENPATQIRLPAPGPGEPRRVATPGEFARLLEALDPTDALPWALAGYATARSREIALLDWADADLGSGALMLAADEDARKSVAARRIVAMVTPLSGRLAAEWARQGEPKVGRVCPPRAKSRSGVLSLGQLQKRVARVWRGLGFEPIGLQDSRHTAATWLDHAGVSPKVASVIMGHRAPSRAGHPDAAPITLGRYTHILDGEIERARDRLEEFLGTREAEERGLDFRAVFSGAA